MAAKVASVAESRPSNDGRDDLDILHPDRVIRIGGAEVTVREYGFLQGLRIQASAMPIVESLAQAAAKPDLQERMVQDLLAGHADELVVLLAESTGLSREAIAALDDADGQLLMLTWWAVNAGFFVRRVAMRTLARAAAAPSVGATSTPPSSSTGTTPTDSATTPADS